jgi:predicted phosphate transport protein (TIGR00153 family)
MLSRFIPRSERFFGLFGSITSNIVEGAEELRKLMMDRSDLTSRSNKIQEIERRGDLQSHSAIDLLRTSFVTPLDRDDMHLLVNNLDDILDTIEAASHRVVIYGLPQLPPESFALADLSVQCAKEVSFAVEALSNLKELEPVLKHCSEIDRLERQCDDVLNRALARLFREERDPQALLKAKEICEHLEDISDRCTKVSEIVDTIALEA